MRLIGELDNEQHGQVFSAFLRVKGIKSQVDSLDNGKCEIWVKDEDQLQEAIDELKTFQANPDDSKYSAAVGQAKTIVQNEAKKHRQIQKKIVHVGAGNLKRRPPVTLILIAISVVVAIATDFGAAERDAKIYQALQLISVGPPESSEIVRTTAPDDLRCRLASISKGELWRTITPIFIHYGIAHIAFNMYWLFLLGTMIENRYGSWKYSLLVLVSAITANVVQGIVPIGVGGSSAGFVPESQTLISATGGMSGVVYGLFGFVWMKMQYDRASGFRIPQSTITLMVVWFLVCIVQQALPPESKLPLIPSNVANWAHGIGLAVGMAIGYVPAMIRR